jgi:hypothetical protein
MAWTLADLIAEVRQIVQDKANTRYDDNVVRRAAQIGISEVRRLRPDFFFKALHDPLPDLVQADLATPIPLPEFLRASLTTFTAGWIELADSQFEDDARALGLMKILAGSISRVIA